MDEGKNLLKHMEKVHDDFVPMVDKIPLEDKLVASREEDARGLEPWEISSIVEGALRNLPDELGEHVDVLFDIVYDAVSAALDKEI